MSHDWSHEEVLSGWDRKFYPGGIKYPRKFYPTQIKLPISPG